ncbi:defensin alpha-like protein 1 [Peromyscus leucopus]|uniref:defensin alpha-like protein 1 n=1 Tax=Peromyscus leucopus TaxID=10041 RepID=UPI0010A133AB|nr:defensin alpha-like protein 1 [Peromyscus leucopus]
MKTLVLLSALVLLAYLVQADPFPEATEETKNEEQPGIEDHDVPIFFGDPEGSVLQDAAKIWENGISFGPDTPHIGNLTQHGQRNYDSKKE